MYFIVNLPKMQNFKSEVSLFWYPVVILFLDIVMNIYLMLLITQVSKIAHGQLMSDLGLQCSPSKVLSKLLAFQHNGQNAQILWF